jgi:quinohemoprotein ethanol dehydrogenase
MATAGNLVFQGRLDGHFNAYAANTGKLLWSFDASTPVLAPPISYFVDGRQYVTVLTGVSTTASLLGAPIAKFNADYRTQARRVLTFALDAKAALPAPRQADLKPAADPEYHADEAQAARGMNVYGRCAQCHGIGVVAAGNAPDLRTSEITASAEVFRNVVKEGALLPAGMPQFDELTDSEVSDVRQYIRSQAAAWRQRIDGRDATK